MRHILLLCMTILLTACLGKQRPVTESVVYDFGLPDTSARHDIRIDIGRITATDAIDHRRVRYRLQYRDPAQVHFYAHSRWSDSPAALIASKLRSMVNPSKSAACALHIEIESFDQVFSSPESSSGIVRLYVTLQAKDSQQALQSQMLQASASAPSADSKGGVAALREAGTDALKQALQWADVAAEQTTACAA
jgi:cholesterol transport system auxiliary component